MSQNKISKALRDIEAAKREIEELKKARDLAKKEVEDFRKLVPNTQSKKEEVPLYHSKDYWNERYTNELQEKKQLALYEWYLSFDKLYPLLQIVYSNSKRNEETLKLYIPGCGNSSLGEDLLCFDNIQIIAADFSKTLIQAMQLRVSEKNLKNLIYKEGDVFDLNDELSDDYDIIFDKGTLDAISSNEKEAVNNPENEQTKNNLTNIEKYIHEMWRILRVKGVFIVITTMPPEIFEALAIPHLQTLYEKKFINASNWKQGHISHVLKTDAGNDIYYYELTKVYPIKSRQQAIAEGVSALLNEAKKAKEAQNWAEEELKELDLENNKSSSQVENLILTDSTNVFLATDLEGNKGMVLADQSIKIFYLIIGGYDENDIIRIVLSSSLSGNNSTDTKDMFFYLSSEMACESFEYIEIPQKIFDMSQISNEYLKNKVALIENVGSLELYYGSVIMKIPQFGSSFHFSYLRPVISHYKTYSQTYQILAQSETYSIKFPLSFHPPEKRMMGNMNQAGAFVGRRGGKPIQTSKSISIDVEDLENIQRLQFSFKSTGNQHSMQRAMLWVFSTDEKNIQFLLEVDLISLSEGTFATSITTEYIPFQFSNLNFQLDEFDTIQACGDLINDKEIIVRIPYRKKSNNQNQDVLLSSLVTSRMLDWQELKPQPIEKLSLHCHFCDQLIIDSGVLQALHPLPVGVFDENIHEFVCCESADCNQLLSEEMILNPNTLYWGLISCNCPSGCVQEDSLSFPCKMDLSQLDIFTNIGSAVMTSMLPKSKISISQQFLYSLNPVLGVDQCSVKCTRCEALLGSAILKGDSFEKFQFDQELDPATFDFDNFSFTQKEVNIIKFSLSQIKLQCDFPSFSIQGISVSQMVARIAMYIYEKFNKAACVFYCKDTLETNIRSIVIGFKLVAKNYRHGSSLLSTSQDSSLLLNFRPAVKAIVNIGSINEIVKGRESRIPLSYDDFMMLNKIILSKSIPDKDIGGAIIILDL